VSGRPEGLHDIGVENAVAAFPETGLRIAGVASGVVVLVRPQVDDEVSKRAHGRATDDDQDHDQKCDACRQDVSHHVFYSGSNEMNVARAPRA
jgi:hypothetical protein